MADFVKRDFDRAVEDTAKDKHGCMKTKSGKVLTAEEWDRSLTRLMYKPPRMPVELYCKFEQVPQAHLDEEELQESAERLSTPYDREQNAIKPVKPVWMKFEVDNKGKTVCVARPWKRTTPDAQLQYCRDMYDSDLVYSELKLCRGLQDERARQEVLLSKWCKPLTHTMPLDPADDLAKYQKRLLGVYGSSGSSAAGLRPPGKRTAAKASGAAAASQT